MCRTDNDTGHKAGLTVLFITLTKFTKCVLLKLQNIASKLCGYILPSFYMARWASISYFNHHF